MKYILRLIIILTLTSVTFANELTEDYLDIAKNYYDSNNISKALEYVELILSIEPDNTDATDLKNKILPTTTIKDDNETVKIIENTQSSPNDIQIITTESIDTSSIEYNSDYYNTKGLEFFDQKDYDNAIQYFEKSIVLNKNNFIAYNNLAMSYWAKSDLDNAEKNFILANKKNRNYTQPLVNLGNLYKQKGNLAQALSAYKKAISYNKNDYLAYFCLGEYYRSKNNYPEAIKAYQEVLNIDKKNAQTYLRIATCLFEVEEFDYCILTLKKYIELKPDSDYAYWLMAKASVALGNYNEANTFIDSALMIRDCEEYKMEQAKILYNLGIYEIAQMYFEKLLQTNEDAEIFNYLGLCFYKQQNVNSAILNFRKAIDINPLRSIYYYNLAQCFKSINDKKNYMKYINTATKINPINHQDYIDLSYIYFDNSNITYAINTLNDAIRKYPDNKSLYLSKQKIYETIGDTLGYGKTQKEIDERFNKYEEK